MAKNYVNNADFLEQMERYIADRESCEAAGKPLPKIPEYIGECIYKIATRLASRPNFSGYVFKDEMISDGIQTAIQAVDNFTPDKSQNPFAYFTRVIWFAFLTRIKTEKKELYKRYKLSAMHHDSDLSYDHISDFIQNFEESLQRKTVAEKQQRTGPLDQFAEEAGPDTQ
jgi:hypothetical protein